MPYQLVQQTVEIRYTATIVEVLYRGKRVASHARSGETPGATTEPSHQPKSHQRYREWTPTRLLEWAEVVGPFTRRLVEAMLIDKPHPEAGFRAAMGLRALASQYGDARLEAAATRGVRAKLFRLANIRSILHTRLDQQPLAQLSQSWQALTSSSASSVCRSESSACARFPGAARSRNRPPEIRADRRRERSNPRSPACREENRVP